MIVGTCKRLLAFFMLVIFVAAPVLQTLHSHSDADEHVSETSHQQICDPHQQVIDVLHVQCKICDHFAHHQPLSSLDVHTHLLGRFEGTLSDVLPVFDARLLDLPGLSQTNKGPPVLA